MSGHTKGPWEVNSYHFGPPVKLGGATVYSVTFDREVLGNPSPALVCDHISEVEDANLIAAAPELLELLIEARRTLEMWKDVAPAVSLCADIDSAIAKAKGQPQ